ncbi:hypothetical protein AB4G91_02655 [Macrococcoides goetzii]|uniref:hypothetical protein n=1 Tax=Macrococcus sp. PK TaxID=2801919 RepID=UPI001F0FF150|nr:hypothetical protein [Macrococcus sp. PK]MCH4984200.1 hypothetical protein [Macrococcus sp. PK]
MTKDSAKINEQLVQLFQSEKHLETLYDNSILHNYIALIIIEELITDVPSRLIVKDNDDTITVQFIIDKSLHKIIYNKNNKTVEHIILNDNKMIRLLNDSDVRAIKYTGLQYKNSINEIEVLLSSSDASNIAFVKELINMNK